MTDRRKRLCSCVCVNLAIVSAEFGMRSIFITAPLSCFWTSHSLPSSLENNAKGLSQKKNNYFKTTNLSIHATHMKLLLHPNIDQNVWSRVLGQKKTGRLINISFITI